MSLEIPVKIREPATGHLNNALQMANWFIDNFKNMSNEAVGATTLRDMTAVRNRIVAAVDIIEEVKELLANLQTPSDRFRAIRKIRSLL